MPEPILAKTSGVTLEAHTRHVVDEARRWLDAFPFLETKYRRQTDNELRPQLLRAAEAHDQGKRHPTWQRACRMDAKEGGGRHLLKAHLRHELASLDYAQKKGIDLTLPERAAIAAHHSKLSYRHRHRWENDGRGQFEKLWNDFYREARRWSLTPPEQLTEEALRERFRIAGVRALLQLADTRASIQEKGKLNWVPDPNEDLQFTYEFPYDSPRGVQEVVQRGWDEPTMILRAPTGSGKTDASLLWARHQIEKGRADRCVIAMPTRFTSNALSLDVGENVSQTGLYHSSAWYARYKDDAEVSPEAKHRAREMHRMARLLVTPVTVCTIDHLCIALTGTREDHHSIFYHLCNSCIVIDEADFYDPFVQANLQVLLRVFRLFDVPVLVMSATVPDAAKDFYGIGCLEEDTSDLDRTRCYFEDAGEAEAPEDIAPLLRQVADMETPTVTIYANTVKRALAYYDWFRSNTAVKPILYHSRFTEPDKKRIERELIDALGQRVWEHEDKQAAGVAILTQIGEMSLNISAPFMISELCPYDRLAQRAGRLGRFEGMDPGVLYVVTPVKNDALYPAPYGKYNREAGEWTPAPALINTRASLRYGPHSAQNFIDAVDSLYATSEDFSPSSVRIETNRRRLETHLEDDWLIVNARHLDEDAGATDDWRSRDIPHQEIVLTERPDQFDSYADYRAFEQECGVACPTYHIELGKKLSRMPKERVTFQVGDEEEKAWYTHVYSPTEGLILNQERERSYGDRCL